jgi:hypothetical protein
MRTGLFITMKSRRPRANGLGKFRGSNGPHCVYACDELEPFDCAAISEFAVLRTQLVCVCALCVSHISSSRAMERIIELDAARKSFCAAQRGTVT